MTSGRHVTDATIVAAFRAALAHQGLVVLALLALVLVGWRAFRMAELRRAAGAGAGGRGSAGRRGPVAGGPAPTPPVDGRGDGAARPTVAPDLPEATGRKVLRIGFGLLWVLDGVLQAQVSMPVGLPTDVVRPVAASSPEPVRRLVEAVVGVWTYHPVTVAAAVVWIQVGLGVFLLVAPRGRWSRLGGLASAVWGLGVWVFGEAFGGLLVPGVTFLFGAPGAALFYVLAGVLLALPEGAVPARRLGRIVLTVVGALFVVMAALQAVPGRGFWAGRLPAGHGHGPRLGTLASMVRQMAATPQPRFLSSWLSTFAGFDVAHGFAVNLFVVVVLAAVGLCLLTGRRRATRAGLALATVFCLADWVLVQDLGVLGGVGTDPNSMVPVLVLLLAGVLLVEAPVARTAPAAPGTERQPATTAGARVRAWSDRVGRQPSYGLRVLAAFAAVAVVLLGAVPAAVASMNPNADPIVARAADGAPRAADAPAPGFRLVDQTGRRVTLAGMRGKAVALSFLDPAARTAPVLAGALRQADALLGPAGRQQVELVAVDPESPREAPADLAVFDRRHRLSGLANWWFLTGPAAELARLRAAYAADVPTPSAGPAGASAPTYVIDPRGRIRWLLTTRPRAATAAARSSFAVLLVGELRQAMAAG